MKTSLIIPTFNAASHIAPLVAALRAQTAPPDEIIVIDSASSDGTAEKSQELGCRVIPIARHEFDHGGTRQRAVELSQGKILIFLTQDALPANAAALDEIQRPFSDLNVAAVYGRQLPNIDATPLAIHSRIFNYPQHSCVKTQSDITRLGIKAPFLSNSFSAYRKDILLNIGGFPDHIIHSEDMYIAAKLILSGYSISYNSYAMAYHSHNFSLIQEFRRYFDIGVFHSKNKWIKENFGSAGNEGLRYLHSELRFTRKYGFFWLFRSVASCLAKFSGYFLGKRESIIPKAVKRCLGNNKQYWDNRIHYNRISGDRSVPQSKI